ncbi:MAG TPA: hypothetical protein VGM34_04410 [Chlamydiales bacterium]|jgi:hypothetical protein
MKDASFLDARHKTHENLRLLRSILNQCTAEGMIDSGASLYNGVFALLEEVDAVGNWVELEALIAQARAFENDFVAWLSMHGRTSVSLQWPRRIS